MSLPTPTGNPLPYEPGHPLHRMPANLQWLDRERRPGESDEAVIARMEREFLKAKE